MSMFTKLRRPETIAFSRVIDELIGRKVKKNVSWFQILRCDDLLLFSLWVLDRRLDHECVTLTLYRLNDESVHFENNPQID